MVFCIRVEPFLSLSCFYFNLDFYRFFLKSFLSDIVRNRKITLFNVFFNFVKNVNAFRTRQPYLAPNYAKTMLN